MFLKKLVQNLNKRFVRILLISLFFLVLAGEDVCLYYRWYYARIYVRPVLLPILFLMNLLPIVSRNFLLMLGGMICSGFADFFTIQFNVFHQWVGMALYGIAMILYGTVFFQWEYFSFKTKFKSMVLPFAGVLTYVACIEYFSKSHNIGIGYKPFIYLYACSIGYMATGVINLYLNNKSVKVNFALIATFLHRSQYLVRG